MRKLSLLFLSSLFISSAPFSVFFAGSLLQVENYQLVVERFIQSDFPSWEQLANPEYVREKKSRWVPLFSALVKSLLCSSTPILGHGRAAYQHSISVPKQPSFATYRKGGFYQQQIHHFHFVQNTSGLVAALCFTLSCCPF